MGASDCWAEVSPEAGPGHPLEAALLGCHWKVTGGAVRYLRLCKGQAGGRRQKSLPSSPNKSSLSHNQTAFAQTVSGPQGMRPQDTNSPVHGAKS